MPTHKQFRFELDLGSSGYLSRNIAVLKDAGLIRLEKLGHRTRAHVPGVGVTGWSEPAHAHRRGMEDGPPVPEAPEWRRRNLYLLDGDRLLGDPPVGRRALDEIAATDAGVRARARAQGLLPPP